MDSTEIMELMRQMLLVCLQVAGPVLIVSIVVGLLVAIFQAATQIHEQTLTFVPKLLVIALTLLVLGDWISTNLMDFVTHVFELMAQV
ncbi:flagellar biosynthesis protein FliQ [Ruminococcaceae bacterium OttesenSCG-928-A11]|nr:flagellar biosynthesis protein FliQ [Ruminococcaceae bacterium OttesenSCG-928-A11]